MISPDPVGWINTGLPLALLMIIALVLPRFMSGKRTLSHWFVAFSIAIASVSLIFLGAVVFAVVALLSGADVGGAFVENRMGTIQFFLRSSFKAVLFWGPVLALVWFSLAQAVEKRRGEVQARVEPL